MSEECLLHLERAADVFTTSERREPRRWEKTIQAMSMAIPSIRLKDDPEGYAKIPNLEALLRFKACLSDLHKMVATGKVEASRRLCEVVMAMGYDHLANFLQAYLDQEIHNQLQQTTLNVFTSIRRKVGNYVREARSKLQNSLNSGAYRMHYCRFCSSQAFIYPKVINRNDIKTPDLTGECFLCGFSAKVRLCAECSAPFFPQEDKKETLCLACRHKGGND